MPVLPRPSRSTIAIRATAVIFSLLAAGTATVLLLEVALQDGSDLWDYVRAVLILVTTAWLAWGAGLALSGLAPQRRTSVPEMQEPQPPTVVLVPICNEDPVTTFARIAAMDRSIRQAGVAAHVAILSDTRDPQAADLERRTFVRLLFDAAA